MIMTNKEVIDDFGEKTQQAFEKVMSVLNEERMISDMLFPMNKEN